MALVSMQILCVKHTQLSSAGFHSFAEIRIAARLVNALIDWLVRLLGKRNLTKIYSKSQVYSQQHPWVPLLSNIKHLAFNRDFSK